MELLEYKGYGVRFVKHIGGLSFREHGPCEIHNSGSVFFSELSELTHNRVRGPCRIYADGSIMYGINSEYHRTDGPAIIRSDGQKFYWINHRMLSAEEFFMKYGVL